MILKLSRAANAVLADLTVAVEVGIVLAALLCIHRVPRTITVSTATPGISGTDTLPT